MTAARKPSKEADEPACASEEPQRIDPGELAERLPQAAFGRPGRLLPPGSRLVLDIDGVAHLGVVQAYDMRWCRGDFPVKVGQITHMLTYSKRLRVYEVPGWNVLPLR